MPSWRTMSTPQKSITVTGLTVAAALLLYVLLRILNQSDPPILVGDGSIVFQADNISKNSDKELHQWKLAHSLRSVGIGTYPDGPITTSYDIKGKDWKITSIGNIDIVSSDALIHGVQEGVLADCPVAWVDGGGSYTCTPSDLSQLTPATLTIEGQPNPLNCGAAPAKCKVQIAYKLIGTQ